MNSDKIEQTVPIFQGTIQNADYREQLVARYKGNPVLEALPQILSAEHAAGLMAHYPERQRNGHLLPAEIRLHLLMDAVHFFEPLPVHIDLEQRISRVIRDAYAGQNPIARQHWRELDERVDRIMQAGRGSACGSSVSSFAIIGMPGIGKTTGVERALWTYPQVIHHQSYRGQPFSRIQIVWLKLTCPHDGSIKGLCLDFSRTIDGMLGTDYYGNHACGGRRTVDELIPAMCRVSWIHCLGLLVIDEIQHRNQAKSGGAERMLNFFLQLMNTLGVPVIPIGTYAALEILSRELRQIRRSSGQGDLIWDRMANDEVWRLFVESLWRYQYTKHQAPLTQELSDGLYDECVGIVDFAVKLFLLAQTRAISTGTERITPAIIRSVAKDSLRLAQPALNAIRTGDMRAVAAMTDLHPIDFESAAQQLRKADLIANLSRGSRLASSVNAASTSPPAEVGAPPEPVSAPKAETALKGVPRGQRQKKAESSSKCRLVQAAESGLAKDLSAHTALSDAGIVNPLFASKT